MTVSKYDMTHRRLRANRHIRELASTVTLSHRDFIQPLFVDESILFRTPIPALTGIHSDTPDSLLKQIEEDMGKGITKFLLFPVPKTKSLTDFDFEFILNTVRSVKSHFGERIWLALDVCLCAYTSHGHCGILNGDGSRVLNDETVQVLAAYGLQLSQAGADCIAPSDVMDGRVAAMRRKLNENDFDHVTIMSYSAKFASQFYGPFRDACRSAPGTGSALQDRKTYQISSYNGWDPVVSALRDQAEGADILMVKPAVPNLDILYRLHQSVKAPLTAYHVSGEYESIELLASQNLLQRDKGHLEVWTSLKRAGASAIISYASRFAKQWIDTIEY